VEWKHAEGGWLLCVLQRRGGDWIGRVLVFRLWFLFSNFELCGWFFLGNIELSFGDASLSFFQAAGVCVFFMSERASGC